MGKPRITVSSYRRQNESWTGLALALVCVVLVVYLGLSFIESLQQRQGQSIIPTAPSAYDLPKGDD